MHYRKHLADGNEGGIWVGEEHFCPLALSNLKGLCDAVPDMMIVISSSWRVMHSMAELRKMLQDYAGIDPARVIDRTPKIVRGQKFSENVPRGREIQEWLDDNTKVPEGSCLMPKYQVDDFMIVDDDSDMAHLKKTNFLQTNPDLGFTYLDATKIARRFLKDPKADLLDHVPQGPLNDGAKLWRLKGATEELRRAQRVYMEARANPEVTAEGREALGQVVAQAAAKVDQVLELINKRPVDATQPSSPSNPSPESLGGDYSNPEQAREGGRTVALPTWDLGPSDSGDSAGGDDKDAQRGNSEGDPIV